MSFDEKTVLRMAKLARLGVSAEEAQKLQTEMKGILGWVEQLNEVNIESVPPMIGTALAAARFRDDKVTDGDKVEKVLSNAPDRDGSFYTVPKVVE